MFDAPHATLSSWKSPHHCHMCLVGSWGLCAVHVAGNMYKGSPITLQPFDPNKDMRLWWSDVLAVQAARSAAQVTKTACCRPLNSHAMMLLNPPRHSPLVRRTSNCHATRLWLATDNHSDHSFIICTNIQSYLKMTKCWRPSTEQIQSLLRQAWVYCRNDIPICFLRRWRNPNLLDTAEMALHFCWTDKSLRGSTAINLPWINKRVYIYMSNTSVRWLQWG